MTSGLVLALLSTGCTINLGSYIGIPSQFLSGVGGWDLSACGGGGLQTCAALMADNQTLIFGGRTADEFARDTASDLLTTYASTVIGP